MNPFVSRLFVNSCAAKRSPFVGKWPSASGSDSQLGLTRDFISASCASTDLGMLHHEIAVRDKENGSRRRRPTEY